MQTVVRVGDAIPTVVERGISGWGVAERDGWSAPKMGRSRGSTARARRVGCARFRSVPGERDETPDGMWPVAWITQVNSHGLEQDVHARPVT